MNNRPASFFDASKSSKPKSSLLLWINLGVLAAVLLIVAPLLLLVDRAVEEYARRQAGESLNQIAWDMRDALDRGMSQRYEDVRRLAGADALTQGTDIGRMRAALGRLQGSDPNYAWVGVAGLDGRVIAATGGLLEGADVSARPWFKGALEHAFVGDVHPAVLLATKLPQSAEPWRFVDIAMPVKNGQGKVVGVLGAHLSWGWARTMRTALIEPRQKTLRTDIWVLKEDGEVLLGPEGLEGKKLALASVAAAKAGRRGYLFEKWPDGEHYATSYIRTQGHQRYPGLGWIVLARQPEEVAFALFESLQARLLAASAVALVLVLLMANLLARRIARPLAALAHAADRHAAGDLATEVPFVDDYREAYVLSRAVAEMADAERRHIGELESVNASLEERVTERTQALLDANEHLGRALAEQAAAENAARESEAVLSDILKHANEAYVSMNGAGIITAWNREAERIFGWRSEEAIGKPLAELIIPEASREAHNRGMAHFLATGHGPIVNKRVELLALRRDGSEFPIELTTSVLQRGGDVLISGLMHDISARKAVAAQLERQALQDALTELPNRRALLDRLPLAMARAVRWRKPAALLFLDLDGFKKINDELGHEAGDELLRQFGQRLQGCVRQTDTVARLAGDEFTVLLEALTAGADDARSIAEKIIVSMQTPFTLRGQPVSVSSSVGIALHVPGSQETVDDLLRRADAAMYVAKRSGKNRTHMSGDEAPLEPAPLP